MAKERRLNFMFEASVGGGIPIIRPLNQSLTADEITKITGILNGTTNYILTKMSRKASHIRRFLKKHRHSDMQKEIRKLMLKVTMHAEK